MCVLQKLMNNHYFFIVLSVIKGKVQISYFNLITTEQLIEKYK